MTRASLLWWCGDRQPEDKGTDARIAGPDADKLAAALGLAEPHLYDLSEDKLQAVRSQAERAVRTDGLRAHLMTLPRRVTHRRRVDLALDAQGGAATAAFAGYACAAVMGVQRRIGVPVKAIGPPTAVHTLIVGPPADTWTPLITLPGAAAIALLDADGAGLAGPSVEAHRVQPGRAEVVAVGPTRGVLWAPPPGCPSVEVAFGPGGAMQARAVAP